MSFRSAGREGNVLDDSSANVQTGEVHMVVLQKIITLWIILLEFFKRRSSSTDLSFYLLCISISVWYCSSVSVASPSLTLCRGLWVAARHVDYLILKCIVILSSTAGHEEQFFLNHTWPCTQSKLKLKWFSVQTWGTKAKQCSIMWACYS